MSTRLLSSLAAIFALLAVCAAPCRAQEVAVKTNLLSDAATNITAGAEIGLAPKWSLEFGGSFNAWTFDQGKRWKHWAVMPELRYWLCDRFGGSFFAAHLLGGQYNVGGIDLGINFLGTDFSKLRDYRYQGWYAGAGLAYGYAWELSKHFNIEAEFGFGFSYTRYDQFRCVGCGRKLNENQSHTYVGPTKAAINLVYIF